MQTSKLNTTNPTNQLDHRPISLPTPPFSHTHPPQHPGLTISHAEHNYKCYPKPSPSYPGQLSLLHLQPICTAATLFHQQAPPQPPQAAQLLLTSLPTGRANLQMLPQTHTTLSWPTATPTPAAATLLLQQALPKPYQTQCHTIHSQHTHITTTTHTHPLQPNMPHKPTKPYPPRQPLSPTATHNLCTHFIPTIPHSPMPNTSHITIPLTLTTDP